MVLILILILILFGGPGEGEGMCGAVRTERETHHDVRTGEIGTAEIFAIIGGRGELAFEEVELRFQVRVQEFRFDAAGDQQGERADEEGARGFDVCTSPFVNIT